MKGTFEVDSAAVRKRLTRFMIIAIFAGITFSMLPRYFIGGMDLATTYPFLTWRYFLSILIGVPILAYLTAAFIGWGMRRARITIDERELHGTDYWMRKRSIPLEEIIELCPFSNNGINAVVAVTYSSGSIYISTRTERYEEIIEFLGTFLPPEAQ